MKAGDRKEIQELIIMAQIYHGRGMHDKAAEVMQLVERMERRLRAESVIALSEFQVFDQERKKLRSAPYLQARTSILAAAVASKPL